LFILLIQHYRSVDEKEQISKNNMKLAQEIFKIMDGPGLVSEILDKTYNHHPGTNNFGTRLNEAKRIHYENRFLASRLDNVQPYYQFTAVHGPPSPQKKNAKKNTKLKKEQPKNGTSAVKGPKQKNHYTKESEGPGPEGEGGGASSPRAASAQPTSPRSIRTAPMSKRNDYHNARKQVSSAKGERPKAESGGGSANLNPKNLIMEHWKIQDGHVLDVAVLKEPFEDRFSLLGIDVDDGQRYQLSLSSEEVSNILEGDMLVTSFDNHNVWLALIEKVSLRPVLAFVKPGSAPVAGASVSVVGEEANSIVSSITGTGQPDENENEHENRDGSIINQEDETFVDDWGSMMNMPAIDIPITSYGPESDYLADAFEDVEDADDGDGKKAEEGEGTQTTTLPAIMPDDSSGVEAAPPPFDFPLTRPSRPLTAGNPREGGGAETGAEAGAERGGRNSARSSARALPPFIQAVDEGVAEEKDRGGSSADVSLNVSAASSISLSMNGDSSKNIQNSPTQARNSKASPQKSMKPKLTPPKPTPPVQPKGPAAAKRPSQAHNSPRKSMAIRRHPRKESVVVDVPWNSNVLVTKVKERMAEIHSVEQEIFVKRRATEYKQKKEQPTVEKTGEQSVTSEGGKDAAGGDATSPESPPKVSFQPEPPSNPRPSAAPASTDSGSFKSPRGRRQTGFPSKVEQQEHQQQQQSDSAEEQAANELEVEQIDQTAQGDEARGPSPVRAV
jgi:hypothetical protein